MWRRWKIKLIVIGKGEEKYADSERWDDEKKQMQIKKKIDESNRKIGKEYYENKITIE